MSKSYSRFSLARRDLSGSSRTVTLVRKPILSSGGPPARHTSSPSHNSGAHDLADHLSLSVTPHDRNVPCSGRGCAESDSSDDDAIVDYSGRLKTFFCPPETRRESALLSCPEYTLVIECDRSL
jgi:hypothetical protein